jgi:hypothetical protein
MKIRTKGPGRRDGYDPLHAPEPGAWLAMDEDARRSSVERYHRAARIEMPNLSVHAIVHTVIENQLAQGIEPVRRALDRLMAGGLDRHDALHAIGSVLATRLFTMMKEQASDSGEYLKAVEELTVEKWKAEPE